MVNRVEKGLADKSLKVPAKFRCEPTVGFCLSDVNQSSNSSNHNREARYSGTNCLSRLFNAEYPPDRTPGRLASAGGFRS